MINLEQIRTKLKEAISQSELTQKEVAEKTGVKHQQISCYLNGKEMPSLETFAKICAVLDLDANEILCIADY